LVSQSPLVHSHCFLPKRGLSMKGSYLQPCWSSSSQTASWIRNGSPKYLEIHRWNPCGSERPWFRARGVYSWGSTDCEPQKICRRRCPDQDNRWQSQRNIIKYLRGIAHNFPMRPGTAYAFSWLVSELYRPVLPNLCATAQKCAARAVEMCRGRMSEINSFQLEVSMMFPTLFANVWFPKFSHGTLLPLHHYIMITAS